MAMVYEFHVLQGGTSDDNTAPYILLGRNEYDLFICLEPPYHSMSRQSLKTTGVRRALMRTKVFAAPGTSQGTSPATKTIEKPVKGAKNGGKRTIVKVDSSATSSKKTKRTTTAPLRASITPGTVLILLAGRFKGKRVVFLKQLPSGLLLVSGPYKLNGVPLQRVNQSYVIATSTTVDISSVKLSEALTDDLFKKAEVARSSKFLKNEEAAMQVEKPKASSTRVALQKEVDTQLRVAIKKVPMLSSYLKSVFTLRRGQAPHTLNF